MDDANEITRTIIGEAIAVHRKLGTAAREVSYETLLMARLEQRGLHVARQVEIDVRDSGIVLHRACRMDLVVEECVVVEIKRAVRFAPLHKNQLLTYLRLSGHRLGLLIDFGRQRLVDGVIRVVNDYDGPPLPPRSGKRSAA
ncbi:MAG: GxxExxY protein [Gemmatimonadaceae bacterium]|nr:GxxExxY protein [Gemmatimonadaceae bacterium]